MLLQKDQFFHNLTFLSLPPDATMLPSGDQSTAYTSSACPGRSSFSFLLRTSHTYGKQQMDSMTQHLQQRSSSMLHTYFSRHSLNGMQWDC